jgi:hypothetical protein
MNYKFTKNIALVKPNEEILLVFNTSTIKIVQL